MTASTSSDGLVTAHEELLTYISCLEVPPEQRSVEVIFPDFRAEGFSRRVENEIVFFRSAATDETFVFTDAMFNLDLDNTSLTVAALLQATSALDTVPELAPSAHSADPNRTTYVAEESVPGQRSLAGTCWQCETGYGFCGFYSGPLGTDEASVVRRLESASCPVDGI